MGVLAHRDMGWMDDRLTRKLWYVPCVHFLEFLSGVSRVGGGGRGKGNPGSLYM